MKYLCTMCSLHALLPALLPHFLLPVLWVLAAMPSSLPSCPTSYCLCCGCWLQCPPPCPCPTAYCLRSGCWLQCPPPCPPAPLPTACALGVGCNALLPALLPHFPLPVLWVLAVAAVHRCTPSYMCSLVQVQIEPCNEYSVNWALSSDLSPEDHVIMTAADPRVG